MWDNLMTTKKETKYSIWMSHLFETLLPTTFITNENFEFQSSQALKLHDEVSLTSSGKRTYLGFKCLGQQDVGCLHISMDNRSGTAIVEVVQGPCSPHSNFLPHLPLHYSSLFPTYNKLKTDSKFGKKK